PLRARRGDAGVPRPRGERRARGRALPSDRRRALSRDPRGDGRRSREPPGLSCTFGPIARRAAASPRDAPDLQLSRLGGTAAVQVAAGGLPRVTTIQLRMPSGTPSLTGWIGKRRVAGTSSGRRTVTIVPSGITKRRASRFESFARRSKRATASSTVHVALT